VTLITQPFVMLFAYSPRSSDLSLKEFKELMQNYCAAFNCISVLYLNLAYHSKPCH